MAGVDYNPIPFQKKSSVFGVSPVNAWLVWPAYFLGKQGSKMQCCFLYSAFLDFALQYNIANGNR